MHIVGFGGFPQTSLLEYVFELAGGRRLLVDQTASPQEPPLELPFEATRLSFYPWPPDDLRKLALAHDVILVCGGNTANMLAVWRLHGFDAVLREAWEAGVVLTGWSAGMICWFEAGVTDSFGPQLGGMRDGLGFLPGSACPHYDGEELRRPVYQRLVRDGFPPGIALDDGVGAHYIGTQLNEIVSLSPSSGGYRVDADGETALPARVRGEAGDLPV
ncbi:MAG TPA: Type 1 glutamine amidotransferase-like domain-containing protein [Gaiellaceae bacterium]|nr:Type 1 glutamine amidotransferase-like domain-containing protein [Gaiellaceae bacterium]